MQALVKVPSEYQVKLVKLVSTSEGFNNYDLVGLAKRSNDGYRHYTECLEGGTYLWEVSPSNLTDIFDQSLVFLFY